LRIADSDEGITTSDYQHFYCDLTTGSYREMIRLLAPFCEKNTDAYQYLYDLDNPIDFLISGGKERLLMPDEEEADMF
jgi:hypothetical protein